jgi:hypothetical protein
VPQLRADNPLDKNVLLYDGEELVGAKQNRILNLTVIVAARSKTLIPVSCVEQGRWSRHSEHFAPAPSTSYPELRKRKAERLAAAPAELGAAQDVVWHAVEERSSHLGVHSPTSAQRDLFTSHADELAKLRKAFPLEPGQSGMVVAIGPARVTLDYVSQPAAFARLQPKLLEGALLDALGQLDGPPSPRGQLEQFVEGVERTPRRRAPSVGPGDDVRFESKTLIGSGLELDGELVQLSGFSR